MTDHIIRTSYQDGPRRNGPRRIKRKSSLIGLPMDREAWHWWYVARFNKTGLETSATMAMYYQLLVLADAPPDELTNTVEVALGTNRNWPGSNYD